MSVTLPFEIILTLIMDTESGAQPSEMEKGFGDEFNFQYTILNIKCSHLPHAVKESIILSKSKQ